MWITAGPFLGRRRTLLHDVGQCAATRYSSFPTMSGNAPRLAALLFPSVNPGVSSGLVGLPLGWGTDDPRDDLETAWW